MTNDVWAIGDSYEPYIGRWSRLVAVEFLDWLAIEPDRRWLDVGCGTGALSSTVLDRCQPRTLVGVDSSQGYVAYAAAHVVDPRARFAVTDAAELPAGVADVVVSGLVLNFLPAQAAALASMRAAAPGGTVAAYVWDYAEGMQLIRHFWDAVLGLDSRTHDLDEAARFPICNLDRIADLWDRGGLDDIEARAIEVPTVFADFDAYWTPFLLGQGPAPGYVVSLDDDRRHKLRERLRSDLPIEADGSIHLTARAWAVRGTSG